MKALVQFFRRSLPLTFSVILFLCILFWFSGLFSHGEDRVNGLFNQHSMIFTQSLFGLYTQHTILWLGGITLFVLVSLLILNLNSKYIFIQERTFMPVLFFGLLAGFPAAVQVISPVAVFSFFLLFSLNKIFNTYRANHSLSSYFEAAFLIGLGSFFWLPGLIFFFPVVAGLAIFRPFNWREWTVAIIGFITPLALYQLYELFFNDRPDNLIVAIVAAFKLHGPYAQNLSKMQLVYLAFVGFLVLASSIKLIQRYDAFKIRSRKIFILFFWVFVTSVFGYLLVPGITYEVLYIGAIPVSFLLTFYFTVDRNPTRFQSILFFVFLVLAYWQAFW